MIEDPKSAWSGSTIRRTARTTYRARGGRVGSVALFELVEIAFRVEAVQPFLDEDRAQASAHGVSAGRRIAQRRDQRSLTTEHIVGQRGDDLANGAHAVGAQL